MSTEAPNPREATEAIQSQVEQMVRGCDSLQEVAALLKGLSIGVPELHDPDTKRNFSTQEIAKLLKEGNVHPTVLSAECPLWLIALLESKGLVST